MYCVFSARPVIRDLRLLHVSPTTRRAGLKCAGAEARAVMQPQLHCTVVKTQRKSSSITLPSLAILIRNVSHRRFCQVVLFVNVVLLFACTTASSGLSWKKASDSADSAPCQPLSSIPHVESNNSAQCLVWSERTPSEMCALSPADRVRRLHSTFLFPDLQPISLYSVFSAGSSNEDWSRRLLAGVRGNDCVRERGTRCTACFDRLATALRRLDDAYRSFDETLFRFDCMPAVDTASATRPFSPNGSCTTCRVCFYHMHEGKRFPYENVFRQIIAMELMNECTLRAFFTAVQGRHSMNMLFSIIEVAACSFKAKPILSYDLLVLFQCIHQHRYSWYKRWLLVQTLSIWRQPPCVNWCYYAQLACPHLATSKVVDYAGHPSFQCRDLDIPLPQEPEKASRCGCVHPCDLHGVVMDGDLTHKHASSHDFYPSRQHCEFRRRQCSHTMADDRRALRVVSASSNMARHRHLVVVVILLAVAVIQ